MSIEVMKQALEAYCKTLHPLWNTRISRTEAEGFFEAGYKAAIAEAEQEQGEPVAWMYDWTSDEGEFIQDWTTSMAETLRDTGKTVITNVRPLYSAPQVIHKPLQHFGEIPMAWCRWSEHLGKWMYTHRQPTEELAWIPLYDHPPQQRKPLMLEKFREMKELLDDNPHQHKKIFTDDELKIIMETTMPVIDWKARYGVELNNGERNKWMLEWFIAFARAIEAAHGIKE